MVIRTPYSLYNPNGVCQLKCIIMQINCLSAIGMNVWPRHFFLALLLLALIACGQPQSPLPTAAPAATLVVPVPTSEQVVPIAVADLRHYTHSSGLFSLNVPQQWVMSERTSAGELISQFTDPSANAVIVSNVLTMTEQLAPEALAATLQRELGTAYGSQPGFVQQPASQQADQGQLIIWQYQSREPGLAARMMQGRSVIRQYGQHVALLTIVVPDDQALRLQPVIAAVLGSYRFGGQPVPPSLRSSALIAIQMQPLQPYTHTADLFRIDVPAQWTIDNQSSPGRAFVSWAAPSQNGWLLVQVLRDDSQRSQKELTKVLTGVISDALGSQLAFAFAPPALQPDDRSTVTWRYQAQADNQVTITMQGTGVVMQRGALIGIIVANLPANQADELTPTLQAVFASLQVNEQATGP